MTPNELNYTRAVSSMIVTTFETGKPTGGYGTLALLDDGAGFSVGHKQATDGGGNLDNIVRRYLSKVHMPSNRDPNRGESDPWYARYVLLPLLEADATTKLDASVPLDAQPEWVQTAAKWIVKMAAVPEWREAQDEIFSERYWNPAVGQARNMGLNEPLSYALCYDSSIHSGHSPRNPLTMRNIRKTFPELPPSKGGNEREWFMAYVTARLKALSAHHRPAVRNTVYRMLAFRNMAMDDYWRLETPLNMRIRRNWLVRLPRPAIDIEES